MLLHIIPNIPNIPNFITISPLTDLTRLLMSSLLMKSLRYSMYQINLIYQINKSFIFCFRFLSEYPGVSFLSIRVIGIKVFTSSSGERVPPWNIPRLKFTLPSSFIPENRTAFHLSSLFCNSSLTFVTTLVFNIWLCETIS